MKVIKLIFLFPTILILCIYFMIENLINDLSINIEYEMEKFKTGDKSGIVLMKTKITKVINQYPLEIYLISFIMWGIKFYIKLQLWK